MIKGIFKDKDKEGGGSVINLLRSIYQSLVQDLRELVSIIGEVEL
jgi:hypothetical protein